MSYIPSFKNSFKTQQGCPHHCALQFIWSIVKTKAAHKNVGQDATDIQNLMRQFIKDTNVEDWKSAISM
jgi:hypothetical protein